MEKYNSVKKPKPKLNLLYQAMIQCKWTNILMTIAILLCIWAIASIQLECIPCIATTFSATMCKKINGVYLNLSYSFLAAFFFYILTSVLPYKQTQKKIQPIIRQKINNIKTDVDSIILEFSRELSEQQNSNIFKNKEEIIRIMGSKPWTDFVPMWQALYKKDISYIALISIYGTQIKTKSLEIIQLYKEYMESNQISDLELLANKKIFSLALQFSQMDISLDDPNGKAYLIDEFYDMYSLIRKIFQSCK